MPSINLSLKEALRDCSKLISQRLEELLPADFSDSKLVEAMRYSALSAGKRIRPFLLLNTAKIFHINAQKALDAAAALEMVHVYSLIHDDLPAMDNDDFRRGIPTNHKKFDEATAILAGDALLTYAFEVLAQNFAKFDAKISCRLILILAKAAGFNGMVGGQMMDLEKAQKAISAEELTRLHRLKTGELFMASVEMGAVIGGASEEELEHLQRFSHDFGLVFQIKDDILDHREGKISQENSSIVDLLGLEKARAQLDILKNQTLAHLEIFGAKADILRELTGFVASRKE